MSRSAMKRERDAVDSEYHSRKNFTIFKIKHLIMNFGNDNHPIKKFTWGCKETLEDNIDENYLYNELHKFRERHYSGHRMYLAVQSSLELNVIQEMIVKYFSDIPNNNLPGIDFNHLTYDNVFKDEYFNSIVYMKSTTNDLSIHINWCLPSISKDYLTKSFKFISKFLNNKGPNGLFDYLNRK